MESLLEHENKFISDTAKEQKHLLNDSEAGKQMIENFNELSEEELQAINGGSDPEAAMEVTSATGHGITTKIKAIAISALLLGGSLGGGIYAATRHNGGHSGGGGGGGGSHGSPGIGGGGDDDGDGG